MLWLPCYPCLYLYLLCMMIDLWVHLIKIVFKYFFLGVWGFLLDFILNLWADYKRLKCIVILSSNNKNVRISTFVYQKALILAFHTPFWLHNKPLWIRTQLQRWFCTQKPVLNVWFKYFWYTKIYIVARLSKLRINLITIFKQFIKTKENCCCPPSLSKTAPDYIYPDINILYY